MNVKDFYKWAKDNDCEDYEINVECYDEEGDISEVWLDSEKIVKKRRFDVLIKCAEQSFRRENCNMLQKSLVERKKMKAYSYYNDINFYNYIVFADNPEEAKSMVAVAEGWNADETEDIEVWREPELDAYHDRDIPATVLLATGWELECPNCGAVNSDDNDLPTYDGNKAYCGKCGAELIWLEDGVLRKTPLKN